MITTIIKRLLQGLVVVFAVMVITFIMLRLIPGDPSRTLAPIATAAQILKLKDQMGIGQSIPVQFGKYIDNLLHGYLGFSFFEKADVTTVIANALPKTALLLLFAIILELTFGFLFGVLAAVKANTWIDKAISGVAVLFQSLPNYWVSIILILSITVKWHLLPSIGYKGPIYAVLRRLCFPFNPWRFSYAHLASMIRQPLAGLCQSGQGQGGPLENIPVQVCIPQLAHSPGHLIWSSIRLHHGRHRRCGIHVWLSGDWITDPERHSQA